jgi:AraC-like DNA-binding protein
MDTAVMGSASYHESPPAPCLAAAVECVWTSAAGATLQKRAPHRVLPDGCMDLLFDFTALGNGRASVIGAMTRPLVFETDGPVDLLGVRFRPGYITGFVGLNALELTDDAVDLHEFWGPLAFEIWERLAAAAPADRTRIVQEVLYSRIDGRIECDPFVRYCVTGLDASAGALRIEDIGRQSGMSVRQLERKFARHLGVSPKLFARIVKFRGVLRAASAARRPDWANIAADFGFADQAHLIREFKSFSGLTPVAYMRSPHAAADVAFLQDAG